MKHDEFTVTPSDYVLHLRLTPDQSKEFENYYNRKMLDDGSEKSRGEIFVDWLRSFEIFNEQNHHLRILRIDPIFDNRKLIKNLVSRGSLIQYKSLDSVK